MLNNMKNVLVCGTIDSTRSVRHNREKGEEDGAGDEEEDSSEERRKIIPKAFSIIKMQIDVEINVE